MIWKILRMLKICNFWKVSRHDEYLHKVSELFIPGQSKVKLRQKLKLYIYPKCCKILKESCTFLFWGRLGHHRDSIFLYFFVQYEYKVRVFVNCRVLNKKLTNKIKRKLPIFASNSTIYFKAQNKLNTKMETKKLKLKINLEILWQISTYLWQPLTYLEKPWQILR